MSYLGNVSAFDCCYFAVVVVVVVVVVYGAFYPLVFTYLYFPGLQTSWQMLLAKVVQKRPSSVTLGIRLRRHYPLAWWTKLYQKIKSWKRQNQNWKNGSCILVGQFCVQFEFVSVWVHFFATYL